MDKYVVVISDLTDEGGPSNVVPYIAHVVSSRAEARRWVKADAERSACKVVERGRCGWWDYYRLEPGGRRVYQFYATLITLS